MRSRRTLLAILGGIAAFAIVVGSAASLGGITSTSLGADDTLVASCDTDGVTSAYTSVYDATAGSGGAYEVGNVTIGGISDTCDTKLMSVTLVGSGGTALGTITQAVPTLAATFTNILDFTGQNSVAENVTGIHVVITG